MKKMPLTLQNEITVKDIEGFLIRKVTRFGSGAKVDCPKEHLGKQVYLLIAKK